MYAGVNPGGAPVMVTVPLTTPGGAPPPGAPPPGVPQDPDELPLEPPELAELPPLPELLELAQHELELLDDDDEDEDIDAIEPLDPEVVEVPHEMAVGLSRRAARRWRPKADAICGSTVTNRTKLAIAMIATCDRCRQPFISYLVPALSGRVATGIAHYRKAEDLLKGGHHGAARYGPCGVKPSRAMTAGRGITAPGSFALKGL
jgi:hypothetical protein